jgi:hypothetical protein
VLKLVRSIFHFNIGNLPQNQAVSHCPPQLNKLDIKQFLEKVYEIGVKMITHLKVIYTILQQLSPRWNSLYDVHGGISAGTVRPVKQW